MEAADVPDDTYGNGKIAQLATQTLHDLKQPPSLLWPQSDLQPFPVTRPRKQTPAMRLVLAINSSSHIKRPSRKGRPSRIHDTCPGNGMVSSTIATGHDCPLRLCNRPNPVSKLAAFRVA
jgi:hypothetical protein